MKLARRSFLFGAGSAALAAPFVVRSGILMPIKSIIQPPTLSVPIYAGAYWVEGSPDGINWTRIQRIVGPEPSIIGRGRYVRVIRDLSWRAPAGLSNA